ncbi:MAG: transglutaminase-like domain-containing protein [Victivallaceae bacterium]|nr:transglutaminase-like domain-containing protein [Victivallaceae bacterium]MDD3703488.1 transglutaminase-like domain-containing protein [Victivallaceae bacterium]
MNKAAEHNKRYIAYQEPQITAPQRLRWHFIYVLLYELIIVAALWQHGEPMFTISLISLALPLGLSAYIPYRLISRSNRFMLQLAVMLGACFWLVFRLHQDVPVDKVLVEVLCGAGLCFIFAQRKADYDYLLMIAFFMLLYGSLVPRKIYISIYLPSLCLMLILFYSSRMRSLGRQADLKTPRGWIFRSWIFLFVHFLMAAIIGWYVFILFPLERAPGEGVFQVSFQTENEMMHNVDSKSWIKNSRLSIRPDAKKSVLSDGKNATAVTEEKKAPVNPSVSGNVSKSNSNMQGRGSAKSSQPGNDLVFRVKSPLKLYWLAKLYDYYDGREWLESGYMKSFRLRHNAGAKIISDSLEQHFVIEKWFSYRLFSAYRMDNIELNHAQNNGFIFNINGYAAELLQAEFPQLPFRYRVNSLIRLPAKRNIFGGTAIDYWEERIGRRHYLQLPPRNVISKRLRDKVAAVVKNVRDPYEKAISLRDYLRNNFVYNQFADPVPDGMEPADYFVFDLKTGHCEYFASALAVMARIAGLPARVATGFSPGNYNAMTGYFEVYEYHAHAWTQIFIEGMGWLTFDASPPGAVQSRTTPLGIGSLRDPFGDSWRVMPPEITPETRKTITDNYAKRMSRDFGRELNAAEKVLLKTAEAPENIREKVNSQFDRLLPGIPGRGMEKMRSIGAMSRDFLKGTLHEFVIKISDWKEWCKQHWIAVIPMILMVTALWYGYRIVYRWIFTTIHLRRGERHFNAALSVSDGDFDLAVNHAYFALRVYLIVLDMPRRKNMELTSYGASVERSFPELKSIIVPVLLIFLKQTYSTRFADREEAAKVINCLSDLRSFTLQTLGMKKD